LIKETLRLFERHPSVADTVGARWDYVLVDEFQDLDPTQYGIVRRLVAGHGNVFAVGDDEQSIFSWRGADPHVLKQFGDDFGIRDPVVLDRNRRCARPIFERARRLIQAEPGLFDKRLEAERDSPFPVEAHGFPDDAVESDWLVADLVRDREACSLSWGDFALLYRRHDVGQRLEGTLVRAGIPCRLARGRALRDNRVIRYVVAALQLMRNPGDPVQVERFAAEVLPEALFEQVRRRVPKGSDDLLLGVRALARALPPGSADTKKAWRLLYHVENLAATYRVHTSVAGLIDELLAGRVGRYENVLEEHHEDLSDPAADPDVVDLANRLTAAHRGEARAVVVGQAASRVALCGLLRGAGIPQVVYAHAADPARPNDVVVDADPLAGFKALQYLHTRALEQDFRDYVAFDLETSDLDIGTCEIIEIGAVRVRGGLVVDRFHRLVKPERGIAAQARAVHGYGNDDLAAAPPFATVWEEFRRFVGGDLLVAHNGFGFDVPVLRRQAEPFGGAADLVVYDSLVLARSLFRSGARLGDLALRFGVATGRAHHALDDAETLVGVFATLGRHQLARARKAALVNLLDYVGLGLALSDRPSGDEAEWFRDKTRPYTLGRYSDCLEFYDAERQRLADPSLPDVEEVILRLGGRDRMERIRAERTAQQRYPDAYARLQRLIAVSHAETLDASVDRMLELVALSSSDGVDIDEHRVNLLTLHATKGLEFSRVYVVGVEDYQLPGYYQTIDQNREEIREARRLLYVGMTRAKDRLVLTRVEHRNGKDAGGNRFLDEMGLVPIPVSGGP
jgi:DNA polymerase III epsilon subunit family exonuclease